MKRERRAISHGRHDAVEMIDQNHNVGSLGGRGSASGAHSHADISRGKRWRIIDAVADHHDGTVFSLGEHNQNFLIRRQPRTYRVDSQACSNGVRNLAPVPRCENNPLHSQLSQPLQKRLCARTQFIGQPYLARQTAVDGNGDNDCAGNPC